MNVNVPGIRDVSPHELQNVAGGWGTVTGRIIMDLLAAWGASPDKQEVWVASLPPSRKP